MRKFLYSILILSLMGCSQANTRGDQTIREYKIRISNNGHLYMVVPISATAETKSGTKIDTDNNPSTRPNVNASLAGQGATATGAAGEIAKMAVEGVKSAYENVVETTTSNIQQASKPNVKPKIDVETKPKPKQNVESKPKLDVEKTVAASLPQPKDFDINKVKWLHTDVSSWPITNTLKSVEIRGNKIFLDYDANKWPGHGVAANPWIFVKQNNTWYAATWEWMRPGQTTKSIVAVSGSHIKRNPLKNFNPKPGEIYGFMVSGLARDRTRNVKERTNIFWLRWPK